MHIVLHLTLAKFLHLALNPYGIQVAWEGWHAKRSLASDRSIVIKKADKGSNVVAWDHIGYIKEVKTYTNFYKDVIFNEKILQELAWISNKLFQNFKFKGSISGKPIKWTLPFTWNSQHLTNVPGRPLVSNCGTKKASEFLDQQLKPVMQKARPYLKQLRYFIKKVTAE